MDAQTIENLQLLKEMPKEALTEVTDRELFSSISGGVPNIEPVKTTEVNVDTANPPLQNNFPNGQMPAPDASVMNNNANLNPNNINLNIGAMLSPKVVVELIDVLMPMLILLACKYFKVSIRKSEVKATQQEKELMIEPVKAMMDRMNINTTNPFIAFGVVMVTVYGSKIAEKIIVDKMEEKEPEYETQMAYNEVTQQMQPVVVPVKKTRKPGAGRPKKIQTV